MQEFLQIINHSKKETVRILVIPLFLLLFLCAAHVGHAQVVLTGNVFQDKDQPVAFAHILIKNSLRGTISNTEGNFQLYIYPKDSLITISCIGYKTKSVPIAINKTHYEIRLEEDARTLGGVVVYAKDYAKELVINAVRNIDFNYPQLKELITGFLRERFSKDTLGREYYHIIESELEVLKDSYHTKTKTGQVRLVNAINVTESEVPPRFQIYAGGHLAHRFDFVIRREGPLDTTRIDAFIFDIMDTTTYEGANLFEVSYHDKDLTTHGKIFILDHSFAIVKMEEFEDLKRNGFQRVLNSDGRQFINVTTEYFFRDSNWRLAYVNYETKFEKDGSFYLNSIYSSHDYKTQTEQIPYHQRLQFGQYILEEAKAIAPTSWQGVNMTLAENKPEPVKDSNKSKSGRSSKNFIRRLEYGASVFYSHYSQAAHHIEFQNNSLLINTDVAPTTDNLYGLSLQYNYRIKENLKLQFSTAGSFGKSTRYRETGVGVGYSIRMGSISRFYVVPQVNYYWINLTSRNGVVNSQDNFTINKVKFDAPRIQLFSGSKYQALAAGLELNYEITFRWRYKLGATYFYTTNYNNGIFLKEDANWFTNTQVFIKEGTEGLKPLSSNEIIMKRDWNFFTGFIYRF
jgi:hypothetical protein